MAAALTPRRASCRVSRLAPLLLLQKIMTCFSPRKRISRAAASALSFSSISYTSWRTLTGLHCASRFQSRPDRLNNMRRDSGFHLKTWRRTAAFAARAAAPPEFSANLAENPYPASGPLHQAPVYRFGPIEGFFVPDDQADGPALRPEFRRRAAIHPLALSYRRRQKRPGCAAACIGHKRGY